MFTPARRSVAAVPTEVCLRFLPGKSGTMRKAIHVLGDECIFPEGMRPVLDRLEELNP